MCGLAGMVSFRPWPDPGSVRRTLEVMTHAIAHRGPDADGHWLDVSRGVALGHRRLSILDLSAAGAQPMHSACGRYVVAFNGEIYNHLALRRVLERAGQAPDWRGHSDTETLLAGIAAWGLQEALRKVCGMFAFALWDRQRGVLSLGRDAMGEKPLYFAGHGGGWIFGSELRALVAGGLTARIDRGALAAYLRLSYVPDHLCILEGVHKVMPGGIVHLRASATPELVRYNAIEQDFGQQPVRTDPDQAVTALEQVLETVVGEQMLSDVPLGCFLSGGIDSSLVASLMQAGSGRQINSFSIGFDDPSFNEAPHAAAVAAHLGTAHTEFTLREDDALDTVCDLARIYDEPFADSSQLPTTLLCRAARRHVTVALTGDGGDEVFGGYTRHIKGPELWARVSGLPRGMRRLAAGGVQGVSGLARRNERLSRRAIVALGLPLTTFDNLPKLASVLRNSDTAEAFYLTLVTTGPDFEDLMAGPCPLPGGDLRTRDPDGLEMAEWIMVRDTTGYLPGDILVKVDRAAMSVGLETRAPLLDFRVARLARQLPVEMHVDGRQGKKLLRALLDRHVPRTLIERPKQGFALPLDRWLRGALKPWGEAILTDEALIAAVGLRASAVRALWSRHQNRRVNAGTQLWSLLMLLLWVREMGIDAAGVISSATASDWPLQASVDRHPATRR